VAEKKENKTFLIRFFFVSLYSTVSLLKKITIFYHYHHFVSIEIFSNYDRKHAQKAYERKFIKKSTPAKRRRRL